MVPISTDLTNPTEDSVVRPEDFFATFAGAHRRVSGRIGCLLFGVEGDPDPARGTAVAVDLNGRRLLVTAAHVVLSEAARRNPWRLLVLPTADDGLALMATECHAVVVALPPSILWASEPLDVAVIELPSGADVPLQFFNGDVCAQATRNVRARWRAALSETTSLPFMVFGFPNFGRVLKPEERAVVFASLSLPAYIAEFEEHPGACASARPPQMHLDVDAREPSDSRALTPLQSRIASQFFEAAADVEPFGGLSGGPVIVAGREGEFLVGIIKQGGRPFGVPRAIATPWDEVASALTLSPEWCSTGGAP